MDEARALRRLEADGLEALGAIELGGAARIGDPTRIGPDAPDADAAALSVRRGRWVLLGRADEDDPDLLVEVVFVHEAVLASFWAAYDEAHPRSTVQAPTGRLLVVDRGLERDAELLRSAYEPDDDGLPWLHDRAAVLAADAQHPVRVFAAPGDGIELFAVNFGEAPFVPVGRPMDVD